MKARYQISVLKLFLIINFVVVLLTNNAFAQNFTGLLPVDGLKEVKVFYSKGHQQRATDLGARVEKAIKFNEKLLKFKPEVSVLVLSAEDWTKYAASVIYGMPHYSNDKTLIVAASDNDFWKSFIPPVQQLPVQLTNEVKAAYGTSDGKLSMQPFFDLLALHELGHAFHQQGGLTMQRKWMSELFCNILLHTYIAENEPDHLPALTVFPRMVVGSGSKEFEFTTLEQFEQNYNLIAQQHPKNYGWYQCRLHSAAREIYDASGSSALVKLWGTLKATAPAKSDEAFTDLLKNSVSQTLADVIVNW